jgi:hypothetical protein
VGVALAIWAQVRIASRDFPVDYGSMVEVEDWLPADSAADGPNVVAFAAPPTQDGLREAARWQLETAQALAAVDGHDLWFRDTCSYYYVFDLGMLLAGSDLPDFEDFRLKRLEIFDFTGTSARVGLVYYHPRDRLREMRAVGGQTERWTWIDGSWTNHTCHYGLGPELWRIIALADPSVISVLNDYADE